MDRVGQVGSRLSETVLPKEVYYDLGKPSTTDLNLAEQDPRRKARSHYASQRIPRKTPIYFNGNNIVQDEDEKRKEFSPQLLLSPGYKMDFLDPEILDPERFPSTDYDEDKPYQNENKDYKAFSSLAPPPSPPSQYSQLSPDHSVPNPSPSDPSQPFPSYPEKSRPFQSFPDQSNLRLSHPTPASSLSYQKPALSYPTPSPSYPTPSSSYPTPSPSFPSHSTSSPTSSPTYSTPSQSYPTPSPPYPTPSPSYPSPTYPTPAPTYPSPAQSYPTPSPTYPTPTPTYPTPAPSYHTHSPTNPTPAPTYPTASPTSPTASSHSYSRREPNKDYKQHKRHSFAFNTNSDPSSFVQVIQTNKLNTIFPKYF